MDGSGSASTVKEPGHFEVRKSSSQVTRSLAHLWGALFSLKKVDAADCFTFTVEIKQIKRSDMVIFSFNFPFTLLPKHSI